MGMELRGAGILVLGMHRSGTSALAHMLHLAGVDVGVRMLGASAGNEAGHWEDAFAVELHERLMSGLGVRWDDAFALPADWREQQAARAAHDAIASYLSTERGAKPWAVKDPRLSLFADLWRDAAASVDMPVSAVVLARHPLEVAQSLAARDGIGMGTALLLWTEHMLAALRAAEKVPAVVIGYRQLLSDWRASSKRIQALPGAGGIDFERHSTAIDQSLRAGLRHHVQEGVGTLPALTARVWQVLEEAMSQGTVAEGITARLAPTLEPLRDLLQPHAADLRDERRRLWERIARVEDPAVAGDLRQLPVQLDELRARMDRHQQSVISAISTDVRSMQDSQVAALQAAAGAQAEAAMARQLSPGLEALRASVDTGTAALISAFSSEVRAMQRAHAEALASAARVEADAGLARQLAPGIEAVRASVEAGNAALIEAISVELRRMQEVTASAMQSAVQHEAASLAALRRAEAAEQAHAAERQRHDELRTLLDAGERDATVLRQETARLREAADSLRQVTASRSWRLTRPFRAMARLLRGQWSAADSQRLRRSVLQRVARTAPPALTRRYLAPALLEAQDVAPMPQQLAADIDLPLAAFSPQAPDVFVWAVIDWHFRTQRPQHLAAAMAGKGHRVFYISNNFVDDAEPGYSVLPLDADGRLFQIHLNLIGAPQIYFGMPSAEQQSMLQRSLARLLAWTGTPAGISIVQHPYWMQLASMVPSPRLVYDCMDHHPGFENNAGEVLAAEQRLVEAADLVVVTSTALEQEVHERARSTAIIRNAADYDFFERRPDTIFRDPTGRRVIGYYGAIAEWFDIALLRTVAERNPDALVLLVGADTVGAAEALADLANVRFVGEVKYLDLPYWLHAFDVCLLPFKVIPLTVATNPVKVYEYLSAGKPVVAVDLPEMTQFGDLVRVAKNPVEYSDAVAEVLAGPQSKDAVAARQAFAREQTWAHRASMLDAQLRALPEPRVSVVVLTYNNLAFTEACLFSLEAYSDYANLEIIVVDNLSSDGSREWLRHWADTASDAGHTRRLVLNERNAGFAAGNNVGLELATGDFIVILNNDTYVTPGWVRTLCAHFKRDPLLGLVGPVTNNIGNEAKLDIHYPDMVAMIAQASEHTRGNPGGEIPLHTAAFFCVAMPRRVLEQVGGLDEAFGLGFFEDDDYCRRVEQAGFRIACAEDVFVHHHLSASFEKIDSDARRNLFERNKAIYEQKWGEWTPHAYRREHS